MYSPKYAQNRLFFGTAAGNCNHIVIKKKIPMKRGIMLHRDFYYLFESFMTVLQKNRPLN